MARDLTKANQITEGVIWKQMILFALPIVVGTLLQQFYTLVDTMVIGRYVGTAALAAVGGSATMVINLIVNFFVALSSGASILISQRFGAGDEKAVSRAVHTGVLLSVIIGAVMTVLGIVGTDALLRLMNTPADAVAYAEEYLKYYFLGMIPAMLYNMGSAILRSVGDSRRPLYYLMACGVANVGLDLLFVITFDMGVMGAALATSAAQVICAVLVLRHLLRRPDCCRLYPVKLRFHSFSLRSMLRIGVPAGMQTIFYNITNVMVQLAINSLGTTSAAAWSVFWRLDSFYWPISNALGIAVMTFVGQNFGAKKTDRITGSIRTGLVLHVSMAALFAVLLALARHPLVAIFTDDAQVRLEAAQICLYLSWPYVTFCAVEIFSSAIRGTGNAIKPTIITLVTICVLRIAYLLTVTFPHTTHLTISLAYPVTWIASSLAYIFYYRFGRWMGPQLED